MIYSGVSNIWGQGDEMCDKQGQNPLFEAVSAQRGVYESGDLYGSGFLRSQLRRKG